LAVLQQSGLVAVPLAILATAVRGPALALGRLGLLALAGLVEAAQTVF
jgi:hypothetical protein